MIMWVSDINQKGFGTWWLQESPWSYIKTGNDRNTYSWRLFEWFKLEEHSTAATCHCPIFCWSRNCSHCSTYRVLLRIFSGFFLGISVLWPNQLLVNAKDDLTDSRILENTSFTKQPNMPNIPHSLFNVVWWHSIAKYIPNGSWLNPDDPNRIALARSFASGCRIRSLWPVSCQTGVHLEKKLNQGLWHFRNRKCTTMMLIPHLTVWTFIFAKSLGVSVNRVWQLRPVFHLSKESEGCRRSIRRSATREDSLTSSPLHNCGVPSGNLRKQFSNSTKSRTDASKFGKIRKMFWGTPIPRKSHLHTCFHVLLHLADWKDVS